MLISIGYGNPSRTQTDSTLTLRMYGSVPREVTAGDSSAASIIVTLEGEEVSSSALNINVGTQSSVTVRMTTTQCRI